MAERWGEPPSTPGMKVNGRMFVIAQAENEIHSFVLAKMQEHGLTYIEELQILNQISASALKYALRIERHGDASKEADLDHDDDDHEDADHDEAGYTLGPVSDGGMDPRDRENTDD